MHERNKWAFWTLVTAGLALVCVPSSMLLDALRRYERFVSGIETSPLRPSKMHGTPHRTDRAGQDPSPRLEFVDFRLRASKAKKVSLVGDFNAWKAGTLPLARMPDGSWELTLPLPAGRYRYRFVVDGEERDDPQCQRSVEAGQRPACVLEVK